MGKTWRGLDKKTRKNYKDFRNKRRAKRTIEVEPKEGRDKRSDYE